MSYGTKPRYPVKSCGFAHAWCKVCRPEIVRGMKGSKMRQKGFKETVHLARGYVPHPTKTMWERHMDAHNIAPYTLEEVVAEIVKSKRHFTKNELQEHFGFDDDLIRKFRSNESKEKRMNMMDKEKRQRIEKRKNDRAARELRIIDMRVDKLFTLEVISKQEGISRERVRQILNAAEKKYGIIFPHNHKVKPEEALKVALHCRVCGEVREVPDSSKDSWRLGFCETHFMGKKGYDYYLQGARWWEMSKQERYNWRYNNDPDRHNSVSTANSKWRKKIKDTEPERWNRIKEHSRKYGKEYHARKRAEAAPKSRPYIPPSEDEEIL